MQVSMPRQMDYLIQTSGTKGIVDSSAIRNVEAGIHAGQPLEFFRASNEFGSVA
jgi:hypothetical protein